MKSTDPIVLLLCVGALYWASERSGFPEGVWLLGFLTMLGLATWYSLVFELPH